MSRRKTAADDTKLTVVANHPEDMKGTLKPVGGSQSDAWNDVIANQTVQTLWVKGCDKETMERRISATVAGL